MFILRCVLLDLMQCLGKIIGFSMGQTGQYVLLLLLILLVEEVAEIAAD